MQRCTTTDILIYYRFKCFLLLHWFVLVNLMDWDFLVNFHFSWSSFYIWTSPPGCWLQTWICFRTRGSPLFQTEEANMGTVSNEPCLYRYTSPRWKALFSFLFYIYMKINTPQLELNIQEEYRQSKRDMYSFYSKCYTWFSSNGTFDISAVWAFGYPWCCCCTLDLMIVLTFIVSLALV